MNDANANEVAKCAKLVSKVFQHPSLAKIIWSCMHLARYFIKDNYRLD